MTLKEKAAELKKKLAESAKFWEDNAQVEPKDFTNEQKQTIDTLNKECQQLNDEIAEAKGYEAQRARQDVMRSLIGAPQGRPEFANTDTRGQAEAQKSIGQAYVQSPEFKEWYERMAPHGGEISAKMRIDSPAWETKALVVSGATSGGSMVHRDYAPNVELPLRPLSIRSVISSGRTSSNLIEYVQVTALTRAAAVVPEATATSSTGYDNAAKPESGMTFQVLQAGVKTIAVWMPITRQILADAPQLESMIDNFLGTDLELALEEAIISGAGGTSFTGLENTAGITPQAFSTDMLTTTRKARTTALVVGRAKSTGFLLNPYDWEALDLTKNATAGNFYFGGPTVMGLQLLWGLPVVESEVIPQGTGYTGDLKQIMLWDREQATLRMTDSHSDFFTHNILALLSELRAALTIGRPAAIVKMDLLLGANS